MDNTARNDVREKKRLEQRLYEIKFANYKVEIKKFESKHCELNNC